MKWVLDHYRAIAGIGLPLVAEAVRRLRKRLREDTSPEAARARSWTYRLLRHIVGKRVREQWIQRYALKRYLNHVIRSTALLKLPGRFGTSLKVDTSYTSLELRDTKVTDDALLAFVGGVLVLGEPGSGKSALIRMLARRTAFLGIARTGPNTRPRRLPVWFDLKDLEPREVDIGNGAAAWSYVTEVFNREILPGIEIFDAADMLERMASGSGVLLLLDGLDEVDTAIRHRVERLIAQTITHLRKLGEGNLVVVTSRPQAMSTATAGFAEHFDQTTHLGSFTSSGIYSFLMRWPYLRGRPEKHAARILDHLQSFPHLLDTCRNPLALSLFVAIDQRVVGGDTEDAVTSDGLPETRAAFFREVTQQLLVKRRIGQLGKPHRAVESLMRARSSVLQKAAWAHMRSDQQFNRIPTLTLLEALDGSELIREGEDAARTLEQLATDSGLLERTDNDEWQFIHRSFLDYFAGLAISQLKSGSQFDALIRWDRSRPERFDEAMYIACGLLSQNESELRELIARLGASHPTMLPRACLEGQCYFGVGFSSAMRSAIDECRPIDDPESVATMSRVLRDYERVCHELGQAPKISTRYFMARLESKLGGERRTTSFLARADVMMLAEQLQPSAKSGSLDPSDLEAMIRACFEPDSLPHIVALALDEGVAIPWTCVLAEGALRSSLVAQRLLGLRASSPQRGPWTRSWALKGSMYGAVVQGALDRLEHKDGTVFPHLALLACVGRPRRLKAIDSASSQVTWPSPFWLALYVLILLAGLVARAARRLSKGIWVPGAMYALGAAILVVAIGSLAHRRRLVAEPSLRQLVNLDPVGAERRLGYKVVLVSKSQPPDRVLVFGRRGIEGRREPANSTPMRRVVVAYESLAPFAWRCFAPAHGYTRISSVAAAQLQQASSDELASLFQTYGS